MAAEALDDPTDLWLATSLDALRGEDGAIDPQMVQGELNRLISEKPHWKKSRPVDLDQGARREALDEDPSWA